MIVLLSPAKSLDLEPHDAWGLPTTQPVFAAEAEVLAGLLAAMSQSELKALLGVSDELTKLNYQRYKAWHSPDTPQKPCVLAFNGPAYQHLRAAEFSEQQARTCQGCLRILSGLYGLLKPLDLVKPYRLDMGRKLRNSRGPTLYAHWTEAVTEQLNKELEGAEHEGSRFIVNCASQEYAKVVDAKRLRHPMYNVLFPGLTAIYAKQARGAMVRHIIVNNAPTIKQLQAFTGNDGEYRFDATAPGPAEKLVFKRVAGAAKGRAQPQEGEVEGQEGDGEERTSAGEKGGSKAGAKRGRAAKQQQAQQQGVKGRGKAGRAAVAAEEPPAKRTRRHK